MSGSREPFPHDLDSTCSSSLLVPPDIPKVRKADGPSETSQPGHREGDTLRAVAAHTYSEVSPQPARAMHWKALP